VSKLLIDKAHPLHSEFEQSGLLSSSTAGEGALRVGVVNLMPKPADPVRDFATLLAAQGNHTVQLLDFTPTPNSITTDDDKLAYRNDHLIPLAQISDQRPDAIILTGFGKEDVAFEDLRFWHEIKAVLNYAEEHDIPVLASCWGSHAALYHHYGVEKGWDLRNKISGVFKQSNAQPDHPIMQDVDATFTMPVSRYGRSDDTAISESRKLQILASSNETGVSVVSDGRILFLTGHPEYPAEALPNEYHRDAAAGTAHLAVPKNVFEGDDPNHEVLPASWRQSAEKLARNWLDSVADKKAEKATQHTTLERARSVPVIITHEQQSPIAALRVK
jgi:homoserine O-succinyltransferase